MSRQSVAEIVAARRAVIEKFDADPSDKNFDLSPFTDGLEHTPIKTKADALAALELIREGILTGGTHLPIVMCQALTRYIEQTACEVGWFPFALFRVGERKRE